MAFRKIKCFLLQGESQESKDLHTILSDAELRRYFDVDSSHASKTNPSVCEVEDRSLHMIPSPPAYKYMLSQGSILISK